MATPSDDRPGAGNELEFFNLLSPNMKKSSSLYASFFKAVLLKTGGPKQILILVETPFLPRAHPLVLCGSWLEQSRLVGS